MIKTEHTPFVPGKMTALCLSAAAEIGEYCNTYFITGGYVRGKKIPLRWRFSLHEHSW